MRISLGAIIELDGGELLHRQVPADLARCPAEAEHHIVERGQMREQGKVLKDYADIAMLGRDDDAPIGHQLVAAGHGAAIDIFKTRNCPQQGGLTGARGPENRRHPAFDEIDIDIAHDGSTLPGFAELAGGDQRLAHVAAPAWRADTSLDTMIIAGSPIATSIRDGTAAWASRSSDA